jgi:hypothetical protein
MGHSTYDHVVSIMPVDGSASAAKASGKRSKWLVPQPGHSSTIYVNVRISWLYIGYFDVP